MNELVRFLLMMTRAETGTLSLEPTPVKLKVLTRDLMRELASERKQKSIQIKITQIPNKQPPVIIDKTALTQVIMNLLSNAIEYSPPGSNILVSIITVEDEVEFSVKDEGMGVARKDQDRIFDKFYRSDKAKEVSQTGTGLGLPLAKSIVESWGGKIWVKSKINKGSTFYFTIPVTGKMAVTSKGEKVSSSASTSRASTRKKKLNLPGSLKPQSL
jgi:signal transduction histidine kinase